MRSHLESHKPSMVIVPLLVTAPNYIFIGVILFLGWQPYLDSPKILHSKASRG